jgi:hypothetical protein
LNYRSGLAGFWFRIPRKGVFQCSTISFGYVFMYGEKFDVGEHLYLRRPTTNFIVW